MCGLCEDASAWWDQSICDNIILLFSSRIRLSSHITQDAVAAQHTYIQALVCFHEISVSILLSDFFFLSLGKSYCLGLGVEDCKGSATVSLLDLCAVCEFNLSP